MNEYFPTINPKATGNRIKELRKENHFTVQYIADFLDLAAPQAVYRWQRGETLPTLDNLVALSYLFGVSMDDIVCRNDEKELGHDHDPWDRAA